MAKRLIVMVAVVVLLMTVLTGCMPGDGRYIDGNYANFLSGIWHGWIAPISLIRSLFNDSIGLYESYNTGWWYDFGFYMAIISGFGGLSLFRSKKKD